MSVNEMALIDRMYWLERHTTSDMQGHLETLRELAKGRDLVVELGVRHGCSTIALLAGRPRQMISVDIMPSSDRIMSIGQAARDAGVRWIYRQGDSLLIDLPDGIDLLMIDTLHTHDQLVGELERHAPRVRPGGAIVCHDTVTFGAHDEPIYTHASPLLRLGEPSGYFGLMRAVNKMIECCPGWSLEAHYDHCHGLTVIRRSS